MAGPWGMSAHPYMMFDAVHRPAFLFHGTMSLVFSTGAPVAGVPTEKVPMPTAVLLAPHRAQGSRWGKEVALDLIPLKSHDRLCGDPLS